MPAATGWAPTLLPSSGGVIARSRFNPELRLPAAIWRAKKSWLPEVASLPFVPSQTVGKFVTPMNYRFFRLFHFLTLRGLGRLLSVAALTRIPYCIAPGA